MPNRKRPGGGLGSVTPWPGPGKPQTLQVTRRYSTNIVIPDSNPSLLYGPETFTGTNGATPSGLWVTGINPTTGGSFLIQNNTAQFTTGSVAGTYQGGNRISRRLSSPQPVNPVMLFSFIWPTTVACYLRAYVRSTNTAFDSQGGYWAEMNPDLNCFLIGKGESYANTDLPTNTSADQVPKTWSVGAKYWCRFGVVGSEIKIRVWNDGAVEPSSWDKVATDSTFLTAGSGVGFSIGAGATSGGGETIRIDDVSVYDAFGADVANEFEGWGVPL